MGGNDGLNTVVPVRRRALPVAALAHRDPGRIGPAPGRRAGPEPGDDRHEVALGCRARGGRLERRLSEFEPVALLGARRLAHRRSAARRAPRLARPLGRRHARGHRQPALVRGDLPVAAEDPARRPGGRADLSEPRELPVPDRRSASGGRRRTRSRRFWRGCGADYGSGLAETALGKVGQDAISSSATLQTVGNGYVSMGSYPSSSLGAGLQLIAADHPRGPRRADPLRHATAVSTITPARTSTTTRCSSTSPTRSRPSSTTSTATASRRTCCS